MLEKILKCCLDMAVICCLFLFCEFVPTFRLLRPETSISTLLMVKGFPVCYIHGMGHFFAASHHAHAPLRMCCSSACQICSPSMMRCASGAVQSPSCSFSSKSI